MFLSSGLTVIEAMTCGLPCFATNRGGPAEIIKHGKSGFHIDPYHVRSPRGMLCFDAVQSCFVVCLPLVHLWLPMRLARR